MVAFIDDHRAIYGVEPICRVLPIAPSTYFRHQAERRDPTQRSARVKYDAVRAVIRRSIWNENHQVYGRKVWRQMGREGPRVGRQSWRFRTTHLAESIIGLLSKRR